MSLNSSGDAVPSMHPTDMDNPSPSPAGLDAAAVERLRSLVQAQVTLGPQASMYSDFIFSVQYKIAKCGDDIDIAKASIERVKRVAASRIPGDISSLLSVADAWTKDQADAYVQRMTGVERGIIQSAMARIAEMRAQQADAFARLQRLVPQL